jgi:hypothetical protein
MKPTKVQFQEIITFVKLSTVEGHSETESASTETAHTALRGAVGLYSSCLFCAHDDPLFQGLPCQPFLKFSCYDHCT